MGYDIYIGNTTMGQNVEHGRVDNPNAPKTPLQLIQCLVGVKDEQLVRAYVTQIVRDVLATKERGEK